MAIVRNITKKIQYFLTLMDNLIESKISFYKIKFGKLSILKFRMIMKLKETDQIIPETSILFS